MRRACRWTPRRSRGYFNPRIPYGMRHPTTGEQYPPLAYFNPRIPYGMRRRANDTFARDLQFQSTHPVWDATTRQPSISAVSHISIHASRMGCDPDSRRRSNTCYHFNPRIPYGMRLGMTDDYDDSYLFQSTHPVWDATCTIPVAYYANRYFNPRIPYGMRRRRSIGRAGRGNFNPRIPYGMRLH